MTDDPDELVERLADFDRIYGPETRTTIEVEVDGQLVEVTALAHDLITAHHHGRGRIVDVETGEIYQITHHDHTTGRDHATARRVKKRAR